ncbi:hypothetical protein IWZ03DRAFT_402849 [Phyllosticta citriasiana]|uniref:Uncharacterized protein n=1 Tax=Phyllosticta citriasiana TaxID=595635 RepID=A0ABR1KXV5_9PEZI
MQGTRIANTRQESGRDNLPQSSRFGIGILHRDVDDKILRSRVCGVLSRVEFQRLANVLAACCLLVFPKTEGEEVRKFTRVAHGHSPIGYGVIFDESAYLNGIFDGFGHARALKEEVEFGKAEGTREEGAVVEVREAVTFFRDDAQTTGIEGRPALLDFGAVETTLQPSHLNDMHRPFIHTSTALSSPSRTAIQHVTRDQVLGQRKVEAGSNRLVSLVASTAFTIYILLAYISKKHVEVLCGTVSDDTILNTHPQDADLSSLYGGNGDRSFDGGEFRFDAPISVSAPETHPAESPPSYDELAPTPPPPLLPQSAEKDSQADAVGTPSKRRRVDDKANPPSPQPTNDQRISDLVATLFSARGSTPRAQIRAETQVSLASQLHDLETRVTTALQAQMDARTQELREELRGEVAALGEQLNEMPDEVLGEADDAMELKLNERVTNIRDELTSYVVGELREVEGLVKDDLCGASISLQLH